MITISQQDDAWYVIRSLIGIAMTAIMTFARFIFKTTKKGTSAKSLHDPYSFATSYLLGLHTHSYFFHEVLNKIGYELIAGIS